MKRFKDARSKLSVQTFKHPRIFIILTMVAINVVILIIAALVAVAIDNDFTNVITAFTDGSVKWMLTPNAILTIEDPATLALAVGVLIIGLVLFSGTIIALTTNTLKSYFDKKQAGSGKVYLEDHIVVLNWNQKIPALVADLLYVKSRQVTVIILSDVDKSTAERQLRDAIDKTGATKAMRANLNVLVKTGDPLLKADLEDVSIGEARAILVMNKEFPPDAGGVAKSDLNILKIILSIAQLDLERKPNLVAEIKDARTKEKLETMNRVVDRLRGYTILPICFDRRLGQIIAQTIVERTMEDVYLALFSFSGSEAYHVKDATFDDVLTHHNHAVPLAQMGDDVYVLADNDKDKALRTDAIVTPEKITMKLLDEACIDDVYIVGDNNKLPFVLDAFKAYERLYGSAFHASHLPYEALDDLIAEVNDKSTPATILLLSEDEADTDALDARVIDALIRLESALPSEKRHIIVELLDPRNDRLIKNFNIENTIISNKLISLMLSKIALFPETASFYDNLLTIEPSAEGKDDYAIVVHRASDLFKLPFPWRLTSTKQFIVNVYHASRKRLMPMGFVKGHEVHLFEGDLHADTPCVVDADDRVILMKL